DRERIIVSLLTPRTYQVLVVRQDASNLTVGATGAIGASRRGTGASVNLPAYENDVLNALTRTGGLPGLDAVNEVVIQRGGLKSGTDLTDQFVRIPLRLPTGSPPTFDPKDVILRNGDIIFIEARDTEFFYVGGLMQPR